MSQQGYQALVISQPQIQVLTKFCHNQQLILTYSVVQQKLKLYLLFSVCERFSSNGAKYLNQTFQSMFLECSTAQKIQLGSDKLKYIVNWGLPHHFKTKLQKSEFLVISLDESLNKSTQNCEMDIEICFLSQEAKDVEIRY